MESALATWQRRAGEAWVHGLTADELQARVDQRRREWSTGPAPRRVDLIATEAGTLVVEFLAAVTLDAPVQIFFGPVATVRSAPPPDHTQIMIATGGTSGAARHAVHTWDTLAVAARGLQTALGGGPIDSVCFLPLHHVGGLMQVVRSFVSGGTLKLADGRALGEGRFPLVPVGAVTSLVPTQLVRLLDQAGGTEWLRGFRAVFLGGGPAWPELLERARRARVPLAPCYGMTETAAQVTMLPPAEFLAGRTGAGQALPHAQIEIVDEQTGAVLARGGEGRIRVRGESVFRGYWPDVAADRREFTTTDRGVLAADGSLTVLGRLDAVIITGGKKVDPGEIEAAIRGTGLVEDVVVLGVPDPEWGEAVAAIVAGTAGREAPLVQRLRALLPGHKVPKIWVAVTSLPRTEAGKVDRAALRDRLVRDRDL